ARAPFRLAAYTQSKSRREFARGCSQSLQHAARTRCVWRSDNRGHEHPEHRIGRGDQRSFVAGRSIPGSRVTLDSAIAARLKAAAGAGGWTEDAGEIAPHLTEWRGRWPGTTPLLLKPSTATQIAEILTVCNGSRTPIVPQGGNTGLVGGQIPSNGEVLLSLERMSRIRSVSPDQNFLIAEAGVVLAAAQQAAATVDRILPLSLAAEGSCTIGGNISTNAGGVHVLRYGMMRELVLGLEVVLANGGVLELM